jgi:hypothetical protein
VTVPYDLKQPVGAQLQSRKGPYRQDFKEQNKVNIHM